MGSDKKTQLLLSCGTLEIKSGRAIMLWPLDSQDEPIDLDAIVDYFDLDPFSAIVRKSSSEKRGYLLKLTRGKCGRFRPRPGALYETEIEDTTIATAGEAVKWHGVHEDEKAVRELDAMDRARRAAYDARDAEAKDLKRNHLQESLEPAKRAYKRAVGSQRAQLLAQIVEYITRN